MGRQNTPLIAFNRGLVSPKALARVDLDRTRLSAEVFTNWLPKTQGAMTLRPGTKYLGSSYRDTGAEWIEFVASTDQVALLEITEGRMRIWQGDDAHSLELLTRPSVSTTLTITDTGWSATSSGGARSSGSASDQIPAMTSSTTSGVQITVSSEDVSASNGGAGWNAADNNTTTVWIDTGDGNNTLPSWWSVDFGSGNSKAITSYSIRASANSSRILNAPEHWRLITSDWDTGTFRTDTGKWTLQDEVTGQTGWSVSQKRSFTTDEGDTGTVTARRHWRFHIVDNQENGLTEVAEFEMFTASSIQQVKTDGGRRVFNATAYGSLARLEKRVIVSDTGTEHALVIEVERGPITLRVGSSQRDDDYISETQLGTGSHNLAFTPNGDFWITLQTDEIVDRIVSSITIGDSGPVEITGPWDATDLANIRYDQSADVVYVDCDGVEQKKIERRGTGRSWSVVDYAPNDGPFLPAASSSAKLQPASYFGNTTLTSDIPFFTPEHVGALFRVFCTGQTGKWPLGAKNAATEAIKVTGIADTGTSPESDTGYSERNIQFRMSGTYQGTVTIEKSIDGPDHGFKPISFNIGAASDTGSFIKNLVDLDDNVEVWYRARLSSWTSGAVLVTAIYQQGGLNGIGRVTGYNNNQSVSIEVLQRFTDTGVATNSWQEGYWSDHNGFPTAVALHGGRLAHAQGGSIFLSVADDYESFDPGTEGDAGPIIKTLGSGPVDSIRYLVSLLRLIIGTAGAELTMRSSSLDEPLTPSNSNAAAFGTQGSANLRALKMDNRAIFAQRSLKRVFMVGAGTQSSSTFGDYEEFELSLLVPDLLAAGVVSIALQRQPDTRIHCVLGDGRVAILTYEPSEEVICWSMFETDGAVEKAMVLPGEDEDAVYYHVRRTISGGNDSFTKILMHFDGLDEETSFIDDNAGGSSHLWLAVEDAQLDQAQRKFGRTSLLLDGTGDCIATDDHADFTLGSSDFTVDFWFKINAAAGVEIRPFGQTDNSVTAAGSSIWSQRLTSNLFRVSLSDGSTFTTVTGVTAITDTNWHHFAVVRSGTSLMLFLDGTLDASATFSGPVNDSSESFVIGGRLPSGLLPWNGWIDEFRLSVGIARWTTNFTPLNHPYPPTNVRYLEKWAMESECEGDTGLTWLMDCAKSQTDTGRTTALTGYTHLAGKSVVVWGDGTGSYPGIDYSPDVEGVQTTYTVDTGVGTITLSSEAHHAVAGLPYTADWKSTKLAYAAEAGTALAQMKRTDKLALVLYQTHNNGVFFGSDSGHLDPLPRVSDAGAAVDADKIYETFDQAAMPFPGLWNEDSRVHLRAKSPRPATVLAIIPTVETNEKV